MAKRTKDQRLERRIDQQGDILLLELLRDLQCLKTSGTAKNAGMTDSARNLSLDAIKEDLRLKLRDGYRRGIKNGIAMGWARHSQNIKSSEPMRDGKNSSKSRSIFSTD